MSRTEAKQLLITFGIETPTEEQITNYLNSVNGEVQKEKVKADTQKAELDRLKKVEEELEAEKNKNLTAEEKVQKALADAEKAKADYAKNSNKLSVEKILIGAGLAEEDYKEFIDGIVSDNAELSTKLATSLAATMTKQKDTAIQKTKEELLDKTPTPGGGRGADGKEKTEAEKIAEGIAKATVDNQKATNDVLANYL
jgi:ribosomal protein L20